VVSSTAFQPAFEAHPARPAHSTDHSADSACLPAFPVTLPTVPQPARTAPPVVESLSFLHRAPSPDARRVLARRTGRPQRPAAVGRAGPFRFRKELYRSSRNGTRPYGPSDSGRTCVLPVGTDRPARRRPAAATARLHRADSLPSLCADEAALPKRRRNLAPVFETQAQKLRRLHCVPFLRIRPTFACSLFALANPVSDIVPSRTPLRSIHPPGGTWVHHHPAAACAAASALRARALRAALRATFC
jgi:hypothetical protein